MRKLEFIIIATIITATGHELHHLLLGDIAGSGVKTYLGLARYAAILLASLLVPLWLSVRLPGRARKASLISLAFFVIFWGAIFMFLGFLFGIIGGLVVLFAGTPLFENSSYLVSPWLLVSTALQFFAGSALLVSGLRFVRKELKNQASVHPQVKGALL